MATYLLPLAGSLAEMIMTRILLIFLGGGTGSVLRYLFSMIPTRFCGYTGLFPIGTFLCNILGCLLIGIFSSLSSRLGLSTELRLALTVGLCGGFTTFSTFTNEGLSLLNNGHLIIYILYVAASIILGLAAVYITGVRC